MDLTSIQRLVEEAFQECIGAVPLDDCPKGGCHRPETCSDCLREAYFDPNLPAVDYNCERRRWMYIVRNLPPAAWDTYELLCLCRGSWEVVLDAAGAEEDGALRVVSAGCGPGSDLLGTLGWIDADGRGLLTGAGVGRVELLGLDAQALWEPLFYRCLEHTVGGDADTTVRFAGLGTNFDEIVAARPHVLQFSWIWSEFSGRLEAARLWNRVATALARPCMVVFIDRTEERVQRLLEFLMNVTPGRLDRVAGVCGERNLRLPVRFSPEVEALLPKKNIRSVSRVFVLR